MTKPGDTRVHSQLTSLAAAFLHNPTLRNAIAFSVMDRETAPYMKRVPLRLRPVEHRDALRFLYDAYLALIVPARRAVWYVLTHSEYLHPDRWSYDPEESLFTKPLLYLGDENDPLLPE